MGKSKNRGTARAVRAKRCLGKNQEPATRGTGRRRLRQLVQRGGARPGGRRGRPPHRGDALPPQLAQDALLRLRAQIGAGGMAVGRARRIQGKATAFRQRWGERAAAPEAGGDAAFGRLRPSAAPLPMPLRTGYGGFEGSPLDPRLTFGSFVVGASNRLAYAAAQEVASAFSTPQAAVQSAVRARQCGLGKTHLLHAISWDVKQRKPEAEVLYLTAERFMSGFVQALRARDALAFKEKLQEDRHPPDRRHGVPARPDHSAGVLPHAELADRRRAAGGGRRRPRADPARQARHAHALAPWRRPRRRDRRHGLRASPQDPARSARKRRAPRRAGSTSPTRCSPSSPSG